MATLAFLLAGLLYLASQALPLAALLWLLQQLDET